MEKKENVLKATLTGQVFGAVENHGQLLESAKVQARSFARITDGIAVLSDFSQNNCHTYSGRFGRTMFSLPEYSLDESSPFEDDIFKYIHREDLLERHILELRFFNFIQTVHVAQRTDYQMSCIIRFVRPDGTTLPMIHNSRYIQWHENGSMWLGMCTYVPLPIVDAKIELGIFNSVTGDIVEKERYTLNDNRILSRRQTEILALLVRGGGSKQIADELNISVHTVNRHRQDILSALKVANTASAVEIALRLHLV